MDIFVLYLFEGPNNKLKMAENGPYLRKNEVRGIQY